MNNFIVQDGLTLLAKHGIEFDYRGDPLLEITHARRLDEVDDFSVCFSRNEAFSESNSISTRNSLIILNAKVERANLPEGNYIFTDRPDLCFCLVASLLLPKARPGIHSTAIISKAAEIGNDVTVGAFVHIDDGVIIGDDVIVEDGCIIRNAIIGSGSHIFPGVKIGSAGLGSYKDANGKWHDFPHFGRVVIGSNVIIQDNTVINRGTLGDTMVGDGVRIGPLCWIGHGVLIGANSFIAQGVTIAGSARIGNGATIWGNASIRDGIRVGENSTIGMGAVVISNVPDRELWIGNPAKLLVRKQ